MTESLNLPHRKLSDVSEATAAPEVRGCRLAAEAKILLRSNDMCLKSRLLADCNVHDRVVLVGGYRNKSGKCEQIRKGGCSNLVAPQK